MGIQWKNGHWWDFDDHHSLDFHFLNEICANKLKFSDFLKDSSLLPTVLLFCFFASLLFYFSAFCFSAFLLLCFLLLCFFASLFFLLFCFFASLFFVFLASVVFFAFLLFCFSAFLLLYFFSSLLFCFAFFCFCSFLLLCFIFFCACLLFSLICFFVSVLLCFFVCFASLLFCCSVFRSPAARWGSLDFITVAFSFLFPSFLPSSSVSFGSLGSQLRAADLGVHCRTSTASSRPQWALPDLNRELQISVGTARPQLRAPVRENVKINARIHAR